MSSSSIVIPKIPHSMQCPDLDGVIEQVALITKKTQDEIREMVKESNITLSGKVIKEIFKTIGTGGQWGYDSRFFGKNKEGLQKGLLEILNGTHKPSIAIRGDIYEEMCQKKAEAEEYIAKEENERKKRKLDIKEESTGV